MTSWNLDWQILHTETWQLYNFHILGVLTTSREIVSFQQFWHPSYDESAAGNGTCQSTLPEIATQLSFPIDSNSFYPIISTCLALLMSLLSMICAQF